MVPTLAPGQDGIDGVILHRLLKEKPVYVRPDRQLINPVSKNKKHFINEIKISFICFVNMGIK